MSIVYPSGDCKHAELQEDKRSASRGQRYKDTLKVTLCNHKRSHRGSQRMAKADSERCCRELKSYSRRRTRRTLRISVPHANTSQLLYPATRFHMVEASTLIPQLDNYSVVVIIPWMDEQHVFQSHRYTVV